MKRFYFTGHHSFSNRGCEAIVRSTVKLLRQQFGDIEVLVPSSNIKRDRIQWQNSEQLGVRFVPAYLPVYNRYWVNLQRLPLPYLKRAGLPFPLPKTLLDTFANVDAVLSIGGDNYSLDYKFPSLLMGLDRAAQAQGTSVILWGASVGPFEAEPDFVPTVLTHLQSMDLIATRESVSTNYLQKYGFKNVVQTVDPAFSLESEFCNISIDDKIKNSQGILGLNISPLIQRYRPRQDSPEKLLHEVAMFIRWVVKQQGMSVLLIPHVVPLNGVKNNNDAIYMGTMLRKLSDIKENVILLNHGLNAAKTKFVISQCRFFIGARTHATIAALSSGVPTISIAYSVKAKGINQDIFGHTDYVLNTPDVSTQSLEKYLIRLLQDEKDIRAMLTSKIVKWQEVARTSTQKLAEIIP